MPPEDPYNNHGQDSMSGKTRSIASSVAMANRGNQNVHVHDVDQDQESGADDEGDREAEALVLESFWTSLCSASRSRFKSSSLH